MKQAFILVVAACLLLHVSTTNHQGQGTSSFSDSETSYLKYNKTSPTRIIGNVSAKLMRYPDVSDKHITFAYGNDIWIASKQGGTAHRLTTHKGQELLPRFSPDGQQVAFTATYDGNTDLYTIPTAGGVLQRITYHPAKDIGVDWHPDGEQIVFSSTRSIGFGYGDQLFSVSRSGGMPTQLPMPYADFASYSQDGSKLAYTPISREFRTWKRYRGGRPSQVWIYDCETKHHQLFSDQHVNDSQPMWYQNRLYFLSDRSANKRSNIWCHDFDDNTTRQITFMSDFDIHFPAIGPNDIIFEAGGHLHLLNLQTEEVTPVHINVVAMEEALKPRRVETSKSVKSLSLSPNAQHVIAESRGDIYTISTEYAYARNLTHTSGIAERYPACSPDGTTLAYWSDAGGEYELVLRCMKTGEEKQVTKLGTGYRYSPQWSPDSQQLAFIDSRGKINVFDRVEGSVTSIAQLGFFYHSVLESYVVSWSADSKWLAYSCNADNSNRAIFLYNRDQKQSHQVTSGFYQCVHPVFGADGKYLFYLSDRAYNRVYSDFESTWVYPNSTQVIAAPLTNDTPSPLAFEDDMDLFSEESEESDTSEVDSLSDSDSEDKEPTLPDEIDVKIDIESFEGRSVVLPPQAGNYWYLSSSPGKIFYLSTATQSSPASLKSFDLETKKEEEICEKVSWYSKRPESDSALVKIESSFSLVSLNQGGEEAKKIDMSGMTATITPREEWVQIFKDAWRIERDYFYDPNMHGVDWKAMYQHYGALIENAASRSDVNYIIGEMIAELNCSHTYRGGGDVEKTESVNVGLLGCDFSYDASGCRIDKIIRGAPWDIHLRSPLDQASLNVNQRDYLLAINGTPVDLDQEVYALLQGLEKKVVRLTVNDRASLDGARDILVKTLGRWEDNGLRYKAAIEERRLAVEKASNGRLGYIHVPNTSDSGQVYLIRSYHAQHQKEGLVIDNRFNGGGEVNDRMIEVLSRKALHYWAMRDCEGLSYPFVVNSGPKAMLINGRAGSGGDSLAYYFKEEQVGPLIGTTTWGGLVGMMGSPRLIDGGIVTVPSFAFFDKEGRWGIEGEGVHPDIEVLENPNLPSPEQDPQLTRAIDYLLDELKKEKYTEPQRPAYEDRSK